MQAEEFAQFLNELREAPAKEFHAAYRAWLEKLATLSTTALALLVSLQKSYVSPNPRGGWLLAGCWGALCLSTLCAAWALYGEAQVHREHLRRTQKTLERLWPQVPAMNVAQLRRQVGFGYSRPRRYLAAGATSFAAFGAALLALTVYAALNL